MFRPACTTDNGAQPRHIAEVARNNAPAGMQVGKHGTTAALESRPCFGTLAANLWCLRGISDAQGGICLQCVLPARRRAAARLPFAPKAVIIAFIPPCLPVSALQAVEGSLHFLRCVYRVVTALFQGDRACRQHCPVTR